MMASPLVRKSLTRLFPNNSSSFFICKCKSYNVYYYFSTSNSKEKQPPPIVNTTGRGTATVSDFLLHRHHFSPEATKQVASVLPLIKNPHKSDSLLSFLRNSGFSNPQLEKTVKSRPELLSADLDKIIKPKIKIFQDFGFSPSDIPEIISKEPLVFHCSANNRIIPALSVLNGLLGSVPEVAKLLKLSGWFLVLDLEKTLVPNVEFLKSCGISMDQITKLIYTFPRFFLHKPQVMKTFVDKADAMGVDRSSGMFIHAARVAGSMTNETWELKLKTLRDLGFSEDDILRAFRNVPFVFAVSAKKIREVTELLLGTGKFDMSCIVNYPTSLLYSIEKRYKPRIQVLTILEEKNLIKKWPSLGTFHLLSDAKFFNKFVHPHLNEVGKVYYGIGEKSSAAKE
ncbi:hypothetical protein BUALT_Bualt08G0023300 [Buddleja alternifolia]|uniref:Uncharacterized protein n=1 Tax=Buddleja alternifolia TaxID=168488 RepID=A0AAV6X4A9_9LAMI|nr:hypothetical protein BUALT_Bualt08G0023300 [Buddleja alternifolia]